MKNATSATPDVPRPSPPVGAVVLAGLESVGKTQLLASLTGRLPVPENFRGSTLACDIYADGDLRWTDTPGLYRESETDTARVALEEISGAERVALVARADRAHEELKTLLPLVAGRSGFVVLTFSDRLAPTCDRDAGVAELSRALGVPVFAVDARRLSGETATSLRAAAVAPDAGVVRFPETPPADLPDLFAPLERRVTFLEKVISNPVAALALLFLPAALAVINANRFADWLYDPLASLLEPLLARIAAWPSLPAALFGGDYGLVSMFPFLILYAAPTIAVFAAILAIYKSSGLIDRLSVALHPWLRPFGIGGRDLVRVVMGFGCNVPAVIASRSCHSCSRGGLRLGDLLRFGLLLSVSGHPCGIRRSRHGENGTDLSGRAHADHVNLPSLYHTQGTSARDKSSSSPRIRPSAPPLVADGMA